VKTAMPAMSVSFKGKTSVVDAHMCSRLCCQSLSVEVTCEIYGCRAQCAHSKPSIGTLQDVEKKADVVAEAMAAMQQEEAAKEDALQQAATMQAALQRAQVARSSNCHADCQTTAEQHHIAGVKLVYSWRWSQSAGQAAG
jgi:hypothetical protein